MTGLLVGALVGGTVATIMLRRRFPAGVGSDERPLELPPPDSATREAALAAATAIVTRLRRAFPSLKSVEG
jgi:hypothetical protein